MGVKRWTLDTSFKGFPKMDIRYLDTCLGDSRDSQVSRSASLDLIVFSFPSTWRVDPVFKQSNPDFKETCCRPCSANKWLSCSSEDLVCWVWFEGFSQGFNFNLFCRSTALFFSVWICRVLLTSQNLLDIFISSPLMLCTSGCYI